MKASGRLGEVLVLTGGQAGLSSHPCPQWAGAVRVDLGSHGPSSLPWGISVFSIANRCSLPNGAEGQGSLYTTVLRELRLWQPPPGRASVAGVLPFWVESGGTSRVLLLSVESSRSVREAPGGRGCSRR